VPDPVSRMQTLIEAVVADLRASKYLFPNGYDGEDGAVKAVNAWGVRADVRTPELAVTPGDDLETTAGTAFDLQVAVYVGKAKPDYAWKQLEDIRLKLKKTLLATMPMTRIANGGGKFEYLGFSRMPPAEMAENFENADAVLAGYARIRVVMKEEMN